VKQTNKPALSSKPSTSIVPTSTSQESTFEPTETNEVFPSTSNSLQPSFQPTNPIISSSGGSNASGSAYSSTQTIYAVLGIIIGFIVLMTLAILYVRYQRVTAMVEQKQIDEEVLDEIINWTTDQNPTSDIVVQNPYFTISQMYRSPPTRTPDVVNPLKPKSASNRAMNELDHDVINMNNPQSQVNSSKSKKKKSNKNDSSRFSPSYSASKFMEQLEDNL